MNRSALIAAILMIVWSPKPAAAMCDAADTNNFWSCMQDQRDQQELRDLERQQLEALEAIRDEVESNLLEPPPDDDGD